ncbi:MAG: glycosyltransferase family 2 protein [Anaerolineales bacterium]|nr:glycosyltransferase family 2 protein [Anaerolineales bacterium]
MGNASISSTLIALLFWLALGVISYTYFGYPLLIWIISRLRPKSESYERHTPYITLLIAAYNEEVIIEDKLINSLSIDYPKEKLQILIVTDGSTDQTPDIVNKFANLGIEKLHQPERRGKMAAINRAMAHARGEIIVFSDANNYYQPDTLKKLIAPFSNLEVGAVSGAKVIGRGDGALGASEGLYWKYESFIKQQESRLGSCTSVSGEILAIRKNTYNTPPDNIINDDFYIAMQVIRQGHRLAYVPDAKSSERVSLTAKDEIIRRTRINAGRYQAIALAGQLLPFNHPVLVWQIISHKFLRPLVPFFMIVLAISNLTAVIYPPRAGGAINLQPPFGVFMLCLQMLFYMLAWFGARPSKQENQSRLIRLLYLPTFLTNSNIAALNGFFQYLRGQQSHIWERIQRR